MAHAPQCFQKLEICVFYQNRFLLLYKLSLLVTGFLYYGCWFVAFIFNLRNLFQILPRYDMPLDRSTFISEKTSGVGLSSDKKMPFI